MIETLTQIKREEENNGTECVSERDRTNAHTTKSQPNELYDKCASADKLSINAMKYSNGGYHFGVSIIKKKSCDYLMI